jgi:low affinity Fe/Cu permease
MSWLETISCHATKCSGSSWAFLVAALVIVAWLATGPFVGYSDTWQLIINTGTTIVTFLMVFLVQRAQNKDSLVIQTKLNELLAAGRASNRLIDLEDLSEAEVRQLHARFQEMAKQVARSKDPKARTSIEEIEESLEKSKS